MQTLPHHPLLEGVGEWDRGLRGWPAAGPPGRLTSTVWAGDWPIFKLSLAGRRKASAIVSLSGHQGSPRCRSLESSADQGVSEQTHVCIQWFFSERQSLGGRDDLYFISYWAPESKLGAWHIVGAQ